MLDTVALAGGDFDSDHALVMASFHLCLKSAIKFQKNSRDSILSFRKTSQLATVTRWILILALKTLLENSSMNPHEIDLDALVNKSTEIFIKTAETVLGRTNGSEKPWKTDEIIQLYKDKCADANRQDRESRDIYKHLKQLTEKKIKRALTAYIHNKCDQYELDFRKSKTHAVYKRIRELSRRKTTLTNVRLDKDGTSPACHCHPINPNPATLRNLTISPSEPSPLPLRSEFEAVLKSLKSNKSPGPDGLHAKLPKVDEEVVTDLYHKIATAAWHKKYFPKTFCSATMIPLHKRRPKAKCDNYHPISLTS